MKKYFIALVITLISIFSFNIDVSASSFTYNGVTFDSDDIVSKVNDYFDIDINSEAPFQVAYEFEDGSLFFVFLKNLGFYSYDDPNFSVNTNDISYLKNDNYYSKTWFSISSFGYSLNSWGNRYIYKYDFNTNEEIFGLSYGSNASVFNPSDSSTSAHNNRIYFLTSNEIENGNEYELAQNKLIYSNFNLWFYGYDFHYTKDKLINMTKTFANDLDGNEIYIIRSDFTNVFDSDYTYQIKTDYTDWQDITSDIFLAAESGYYFYDYTLRYNSKVYARVLNMQGEVVEINEIEVTELKDYMNITYAPANDLNGNYVITFTVDLRNCWNNSYTYQYSYDNETFYNMCVNEDNQVFYLNHGIQTPVHFRIIDSSNNVIYKKDYIETFEGLSFSPITEEFIEIVNGFRMIGYSIDISKFMAFSDIYNYRFVINGIEQDAREVFTWNIYEENFDTFEEIDFKLYVDNYLISNIKYSPRYTQDNFDDKYTEIADNILNKDDSIYGFIDMFKNAFEDFYSSIISIGSDINNLWIGMPEVLRNFFIVIFVLILFGFIIRFIL